MHSPDDVAWLRLVAAEGVGVHTTRMLLGEFGDAQAVIAAASDGGIEALADLPMATRTALAAAIRVSNPLGEIERLTRLGGRMVAWDDPAYPPGLVTIPDPPAVLRVAGHDAALSMPSVAVVGTRRCSDEAVRQATRFTRGLSTAGVCIISGGARGVDAAAHRAALADDGITVAVMGCGLGQTYPPEHAGLYDEIRAQGGALVSEYAMDRAPRPGQFPRRNRLISGMSMGVLVIEAPRRSGALGTARMAVESHGRECWVVAADAGRREARGGLEALRDGWCGMALDPADVLADLGARRDGPEGGVPPESGPAFAIDLDEDQQGLARLLRRHGGMPAGRLFEEAEQPPHAVMAALTSLELLGVVQRRGSDVALTPAGVALAAGLDRGDGLSRRNGA